ncbi:putative pilus assembly protein FilE [Acinetobacter vivianii]|uniref:putative pilus assembly protein FilE n=1 Tax=Acinetobacter vivianii TaxID=1776742 RepID=UPI002DBD06FC|nr:putative pilus assembly protein FilE [Acinetobacter vivianii]MEB6481324.1 putative pilus assembly protein FilE [Acinetobacter vivianii]MEB6659608.1 putative pilus assembly protein FilE [Acinetobacter vivianii]
MYKMIKQPLLVTLFVALSSGGVVYAEEGFYTIIGPDGRPMIIPQKKQSQPVKTIPVQQTQEKVTQVEKVEPVVVEKKQPDKKEAASSKPAAAMAVPKESSIQKQTTDGKVSHPRVIAPASSTQVKKVDEVKKEQLQPSVAETARPTVTSSQKSPPVHIEPTIAAKPSLTSEKPNKKEVVVPSQQSSDAVNVESSTAAPLSKIDGVEYVNNEYLEDQEFNLDGKKRFYTMPDGTGRMETIERKKGVNQSMLNRLLNRNPKPEEPIVLSSTYIRLSAEDLAATFENDRCFLKDYKKSIKTLTPKKEVGVWPRKPLKEKFEYEVVKLDHSVEYMQIASYASSNEKPVYYWPLVVFLDEKGCAQEAVSGFKNNSLNTTLLQHSAIQGVIKIPPKAEYMMMTPLASAIDVPESELSNQGQIRISALK